MSQVSSLQIAINNEAREHQFYLAEAERSQNPMVRKLLQHLAKEEVEHEEWIRRRHELMVKSGKWPATVDWDESDSTLKDAMAALDYAADETSAHDDDDIACLKKAIQFEMDAADFYFKLAGDASTEAERAFFLFLAKTEQDHMASLRDSLGYLEDPQGWYVANGPHVG